MDNALHGTMGRTCEKSAASHIAVFVILKEKGLPFKEAEQVGVRQHRDSQGSAVLGAPGARGEVELLGQMIS
jgi:hypothetical protein